MPDREETNTKWPRPRSTIPGTSARVSWIGARRFTSRARSISSGVNDSSRPLAGSPAFATSTSTSPARSTSVVAAPASARSASRTSALLAQLGPQLLERAGAPAAQQDTRAAAVKGSGDSLADATAGAREQDRRSPELHGSGRYCTRIARRRRMSFEAREEGA